VRWREFSGAELIWLVHSSTTEQLKQDKPTQVRQYLNGTKDYTALREWDRSQIKDSQDK
jgi:hypothetical protein